MLASCGFDPHENDIVARVISPDGRPEAVYAVFHGGGPAVVVSDDVQVHPVGTQIQLFDRVFHTECSAHLSLKWEAIRTLRVGYKVGRDAVDPPQPAAPLWGDDQAEFLTIHRIAICAPADVSTGTLSPEW